MGTSKNSASDRLVGILSPIEGKNAGNTLCIHEYFDKEWGKNIRQDGRRWVFRGALLSILSEISCSAMRIVFPGCIKTIMRRAAQ